MFVETCFLAALEALSCAGVIFPADDTYWTKTFDITVLQQLLMSCNSLFFFFFINEPDVIPALVVFARSEVPTCKVPVLVASMWRFIRGHLDRLTH